MGLRGPECNRGWAHSKSTNDEKTCQKETGSVTLQRWETAIELHLSQG